MSTPNEVLKIQTESAAKLLSGIEAIDHTNSLIAEHQHILKAGGGSDDPEGDKYFKDVINGFEVRKEAEAEELGQYYTEAAAILVEHEAELFELALIEGYMRDNQPRVEPPLVIGLPSSDS